MRFFQKMLIFLSILFLNIQLFGQQQPVPKPILPAGLQAPRPYGQPVAAPVAPASIPKVAPKPFESHYTTKPKPEVQPESNAAQIKTVKIWGAKVPSKPLVKVTEVPKVKEPSKLSKWASNVKAKYDAWKANRMVGKASRTLKKSQLTTQQQEDINFLDKQAKVIKEKENALKQLKKIKGDAAEGVKTNIQALERDIVDLKAKRETTKESLRESLTKASTAKGIAQKTGVTAVGSGIKKAAVGTKEYLKEQVQIVKAKAALRKADKQAIAEVKESTAKTMSEFEQKVKDLEKYTTKKAAEKEEGEFLSNVSGAIEQSRIKPVLTETQKRAKREEAEQSRQNEKQQQEATEFYANRPE